MSPIHARNTPFCNSSDYTMTIAASYPPNGKAYLPAVFTPSSKSSIAKRTPHRGSTWVSMTEWRHAASPTDKEDLRERFVGEVDLPERMSIPSCH